MLNLTKIETAEQKNPLLYLDYNEKSLRVVLDKHNRPWLVIGDICQVLDIAQQHHILRKNSLLPYIAMAVMETPSGPYQLFLINQEGAERLFTIFNLSKHTGFLGWLRDTLPNVARNGAPNPPKLNLDDIIEG